MGFEAVRWWSEFAAGPLASIAPIFGIIATLLWGYSIHRRLIRKNRLLAERVAEAEAKAAAAEKTSAMKSEFLASMSHEMRMPMTGILSFAEMAMTTTLSPLQREYLDRVLTSAEWLTHVLSDVLDFSRIEASRIELENKDFSFSNCIDSAAKMVQPAAARKHLDLTYKVDAAVPPVVNGDAARLRQVTVNLLDNAVRFTTSGSVVLYAGVVSETEETITIYIAVADTGIGIPQERQSSIFEPFNGSTRQTADRTGGTGLGLSICRKLAEMMGGGIEVQSHVGAGSTFRFTAMLRKVVRPARRSEDMEVLSKLTTHRLSILVADESAVHRRLLGKLLESAGHQVSPASTGKQALEIFCTDLFDLVLLSTQLPDADAVGMAESLRDAEGETTRTYIYGLRQECDRVSTSEYVRRGLDGCIQRPAGAEELLTVVNQVARARAALQR